MGSRAIGFLPRRIITHPSLDSSVLFNLTRAGAVLGCSRRASQGRRINVWPASGAITIVAIVNLTRGSHTSRALYVVVANCTASGPGRGRRTEEGTRNATCRWLQKGWSCTCPADGYRFCLGLLDVWLPSDNYSRNCLSRRGHARSLQSIRKVRSMLALAGTREYTHSRARYSLRVCAWTCVAARPRRLARRGIR